VTLNLRAGDSNVTRTCLLGLPVRRPKPLPITSLQMRSVRTALSRLPEKRLRQVLVLYTRSEILVTNDSGPAHFASMTPIHVVTLFGPETPALFAARSPNATALWAGIACSRA
jgi:ADP-heptose:LPS heptosyltransferase